MTMTRGGIFLRGLFFGVALAVTLAVASISVILILTKESRAQQQQPPISTTALQQQRNLAFDLQAQAVAQIELLAQENAKLKARVEQLEKPSEKKPD